MSENGNSDQKPRKRGLTSVMLGWLADRLRRAEEIKHKINTGTYEVNSEKVAESLLNDAVGK